jgi:rod shape-determining protein MreC
MPVPARDRRLRLAIVGAVFVLLLALSSIGPVRSFFLDIASAAWSAQTGAGSMLGGALDLLSSKRGLTAENDRLKTELEEAKTNFLLVGILERENAELKRLLGREDEREGVLATVLVKPPKSPYDTLLLDVGALQGVALGDAVMLHAVSLGEISEVFAHTSTARLFSSPDAKTPVTIGEDGIQAEALGKGGGNFEVRVPKEVDVHEGDPVYVPSISPSVFGVVESVTSEPTDAFQKVLFKTPINIATLRWVEIRTKDQ